METKLLKKCIEINKKLRKPIAFYRYSPHVESITIVIFDGGFTAKRSIYTLDYYCDTNKAFKRFTDEDGRQHNCAVNILDELNKILEG